MEINLVDLPKIETFDIPKNSAIYDDFVTYYEEAQFALKLFRDKLNKLQASSRILEVGSGIGLLANHLVFCGFQDVTTIEPDSEGFGNMIEISKIVRRHKLYRENKLKTYFTYLNEFQGDGNYQFIFSFNVMEHIDNPGKAFTKIRELLIKDGYYYFICPNYLFPYEGHFNIPIIYNKKLTYFFFKRHINSYRTLDALGLWNSLNWINPISIRKSTKGMFKADFSDRASELYFDRFNQDQKFQERKGVLMKFIAKSAKPIIKMLPTICKPVIECSLTHDYKL